MKYLVIAVLMLAASVHAQPIPPPLLGSTIEPVNGVALIPFDNGVGADVVKFQLDRADCSGPAQAVLGDSGDPQQGIVQVPAGPPFDVGCLLRPGDRVYLLRYHVGAFIDQIGPYVVPMKVWLPVVMR